MEPHGNGVIGTSLTLKVPHKQPKRGRVWLNDGSCIRLRPEYANHVWSYDFVEDRTHNGRKYRMLNIIDEFTRECLAIRVSRRLKAVDVIDALTDLFILRGIPACAFHGIRPSIPRASGRPNYAAHLADRLLRFAHVSEVARLGQQSGLRAEREFSKIIFMDASIAGIHLVLASCGRRPIG